MIFVRKITNLVLELFSCLLFLSVSQMYNDKILVCANRTSEINKMNVQHAQAVYDFKLENPRKYGKRFVKKKNKSILVA